MFFRLAHELALFLLMVGVGTTIVPIWRAWVVKDLETRALMLSEAQNAETRWLLPGVIATAFTGVAWAASENMNLVRTGWLLTLLIVFAIDFLIFLPLMGVGLRRVRLLALQARKRGEMTEELEDALRDNVPVVFGTLIVLTIPIMVWLPVYKPF